MPGINPSIKGTPIMEDDSVLNLLKPFLALYGSVFFLLTAVGLLNTYLSLRLSMAGVPVQTTGLVMTVYFLGLAAGAFVCGPIIRTVGHIRAFSAFAAASTAAVLIHGIVLSVPLWTVLRFVSGLANMGLYMVIESWLNECADGKVRGRVFAFYMVVCYLGGAIGQMMLNFANDRTQTLYLVIGVLMVLSIIPISLTRSIHPKLPEPEGIRFSTICRKTPIGLAGTFAAGLLISGFNAMAPVFAHQIALPLSHLSWFMTLTILGGFLLQWPVGALSDRIDRSLLLPGLGLTLAAVALFMAVACQNSETLLLGATPVFGGLLFAIYPVSVARAHDVFEPKDVVRVSSALLLVYSAGAVVGPMLSAAFMEQTRSAFGLYYYFTACSLLFGLFTLVLRTSETVAIIPAEEQVDFVIMKKTSAVAMHMDPRQEEEETAEMPSDEAR